MRLDVFALDVDYLTAGRDRAMVVCTWPSGPSLQTDKKSPAMAGLGGCRPFQVVF